MENTQTWVDLYQKERMPAVEIAAKVGADPGTVSSWLKKHGVELYGGLHRVEREPPKVSAELGQLLNEGPDEVLKFLDEKVWGIGASPAGLEQLTKFCKFLTLPLDMGVMEVKEELVIEKSMVKAWTQGTKQPYLVRVADTAVRTTTKPGWKLLPLWLESGGNSQGPWIQVPSAIQTYDDVTRVVGQLKPLESTYQRGTRFGLTPQQIDEMRSDLLGYLLGMMAGDASKAGGKQKRFASSNIDLHLTLKRPTNENLGEFVCMCTNSLGIIMDRRQDKQPTGTTRFGRHPSAAYRWTSERSPLLAWMFSVGLGLKWGEYTTLNQLRMDWIFDAPFSFRKRFAQAMADSDGCVKKYVVEITSVPNADFVTDLLHSLNLPSAYTRIEKGIPLRSVVRAREGANLPIINEFTHGYRYDQLMRYKRD
jgi:hypothetical protein